MADGDYVYVFREWDDYYYGSNDRWHPRGFIIDFGRDASKVIEVVRVKRHGRTDDEICESLCGYYKDPKGEKEGVYLGKGRVWTRDVDEIPWCKHFPDGYEDPEDAIRANADVRVKAAR